MAFTRAAALLHAALSDVTTAQHHVATIAGDLNLADMAARAHGDLSDAPTDAHHTLYTDAEALAAVEAAAEITIQGQITFPASQSASAGVNTLDDYEEGTWTPAIADDSFDGSGEGQVYSVQVGGYTKIGNRVWYNCRVVITDLGTLTAGQRVSLVGLPFTTTSVANREGVASVGRGSGLAIPVAGQTITGIPDGNSAKISMHLWDATAGPTAFLISELSVDGDLVIDGCYEV